MSTPADYSPVNIALVQARESVMTYFRPAFNDAGITEQQWRIICLLAENTTLDFQDLSDRACILRPSLTGVLNRLERAGLLQRLRPSNDQRRVFLRLTAAGKQLYSQTQPLVTAGQQQLSQDFGQDKLQQLQQLLHELRQLPPTAKEEQAD